MEGAGLQCQSRFNLISINITFVFQGCVFCFVLTFFQENNLAVHPSLKKLS